MDEEGAGSSPAAVPNLQVEMMTWRNRMCLNGFRQAAASIPPASPQPRALPHLIDLVTPSDEAVSLHEAGHACVALVCGCPPALMEIIDGPPPYGRTSIPPAQDADTRRYIACAGFAVEVWLFKAGRIVDALGQKLTEKHFIQVSVAQNAALDKVKFFGEDRERADKTWPPADDLTFMTYGQNLAKQLPIACVEALATALLNERRLSGVRILEIAKPLLP